MVDRGIADWPELPRVTSSLDIDGLVGSVAPPTAEDDTVVAATLLDPDPSVDEGKAADSVLARDAPE